MIAIIEKSWGTGIGRLNFNLLSIDAVNIHNVNEAFLVRTNSIVENHITAIYTCAVCKIHEFPITKLARIYRTGYFRNAVSIFHYK